ncbi:MAG TPA: M1 family metallopeptidase [Longimicrobiales bacterium]|nr:M1 family metallopeptidase [Longimicrobiales bacterium]
MRSIRFGWAVLLMSLAAACARSPQTTTVPLPPAGGEAGTPAPVQTTPALSPVLPEDVHSFANPLEARVTHVGLRLFVDFEDRSLQGAATLDFQRIPDARELVLDTRGLDIRNVTTPAGDPLEWALGEEVAHLGRALRIALPRDLTRVEVHYRTGAEAAAVQWLDPAQTAGGEAPFLFTQGQAILTRTWIPTQDSPGIRQTYTATLTVPAELRAVMSAEMLTPDGEATELGRVFAFRMDRPIPPYLIALAVGDLAFRSVGPRTGVWAEPPVVEAAAYELADMEAMLEAAESLYGPYRWGRYDVLVLPPSFPFGGMENPRLTFATPTILAGDRSLVSLIAHELAHSWSGNLVTNATWSDFWLNEGFTSYIENRIMERVYGAEYAAMLEVLAREGLAAEIEALGGPTSSETILHLELAGRDPDEGMTAIAYDKGAAFLRTVESVVGRERFDRFLRGYFDAHAFQPMTTERFLAYLDQHLLAGHPEWRAAIRPEEWIYRPGLPSNLPPVTSRALADAREEADAFANGQAASSLATQGWSTHEWLHFLASLPRSLPAERLAELDRTFGLSAQGNGEILFAWLRLAIANRYEPAFGALEDFLTRQGRRKFLLPLYQDLARTAWGRELALAIYRQARPTYHAISRGSIDEVLGWPAEG